MQLTMPVKQGAWNPPGRRAIESAADLPASLIVGSYGTRLAAWPSGLDGITPAVVVGGLDAAAGVVPHGHPLSAARADR